MIIEIIIWLLSINLSMWCITLIDLQILKNPCIPGIKPTWSWCMIFLMCCWILIARILLRIFVSMFISDIGLQFSFFMASLSGFGIRVMVASQNECGNFPSSAIFWQSLSRIGVSSSKFLVEFSCEAVWTWAFACWKISDYSFNFRACDGSVKIFYFFLAQVWKVILF